MPPNAIYVVKYPHPAANRSAYRPPCPHESRREDVPAFVQGDDLLGVLLEGQSQSLCRFGGEPLSSDGSAGWTRFENLAEKFPKSIDKNRELIHYGLQIVSGL